MMLGAVDGPGASTKSRGVMVAGSSALLVLAVWLAVDYLRLRALIANLPFPQPEMLYTDSVVWYAPLHICYSVGVDGISVVMLLLSAIIVFTGTFASWKLQPLTKEYFLWFTLLSTGVFGSSFLPTFSPCSCFMRWLSFRCTCSSVYGAAGVRNMPP